jgi:hypothetical protein
LNRIAPKQVGSNHRVARDGAVCDGSAWNISQSSEDLRAFTGLIPNTVRLDVETNIIRANTIFLFIIFSYQCDGSPSHKKLFVKLP